MAIQNVLSAAANILKDRIEPFMGAILRKQCVIFDLFEPNAKGLRSGGKKFKSAIDLTPMKGGGLGYKSNTAIRDPFTPTYANPEQYLKTHYLAFDLEHMASIRAEGGEGAWINFKVHEMRRKAEFFAEELNREMCGDGTDYVCEVGATPANSSPENIQEHLWSPANMYLGVGREIHFLDADGDTTHHSAITNYGTVTASTSTTVTYTLDGGSVTGLAQADWVGLRGSLYDKSTASLTTGEAAANALTGFRAAFDSSDPICAGESGFAGLQNLDVSTYPDWVATVLANGGTKRDCTEDLFLEAELAIKQKCNKKPTHMMSNYGIYMNYANNFIGVREFGPKDTTARGGFEKFTYNGRTWILCNDATAYDCYWWDNSDIEYKQLLAPQWIKDPGTGQIFVRKPRSDGVGWEAVYGDSAELWYRNRRALCRLTDLNQETLQL